MVSYRTVERGLGWFFVVVGILDLAAAMFLIVVFAARREWGNTAGEAGVDGDSQPFPGAARGLERGKDPGGRAVSQIEDVV